MEGWYFVLFYSGLSLSIGVLVYILLRDKARREQAQREAERLEALERGETGDLSVKELEKIFREKG